MKQHFRLDTHPLADPANVVRGDHYRITVLDAGLVRLEYDESGTFEDRASQTAVNRAFAPSDFAVTETEDRLEIHTDRLHLIYDKGPFTTHGLSVQAKGGYHSNDSVWRYGQDTPNLGGTARTLDDVDGAIPLEDGVLAFNGVALVDDSATVLLEDDGWIAPRRAGQPRPLRVRLRPRLPRGPQGALRADRARRRCCRATRWATGGAATTPTPPTSTSTLMDRFARRGRAALGRGHRHGLAPGRHRPEVRQRLDRLHLEHRPVPRPARLPRRPARARARHRRSTCTRPRACTRTRRRTPRSRSGWASTRPPSCR